ncbi:hypothetical protein ACFSTH_06735 [Paenibacillus yanchengensis]|uniref:DUF4352 domain-containing protein n=1 Tax=Paenibacillus yanchengensis TaxID=2035833 RepID=A0ABW4YIR4_9BACL
MKRLMLIMIVIVLVLSLVMLPTATYAEVDQVSDTDKMESIRSGIDKHVIDGISDNTLNLSATEAIMYLNIDSELNFQYFKSLSDSNKLELMNSFVQDNFGEILGVSNCYTIVVFDGQAYALTTTTYYSNINNLSLEYYSDGQSPNIMPEAKKKADEEQKKADEEQKKADAEKKKKQADEKKKKDEAKKKADEAKKKADAEKKKKQADEKKKKDEAKKKADAEKKKKDEAKKKKQAEENKKQAEAKKKALAKELKANKNIPLKIKSKSVSYNSIGIPQANIEYKNVGTKKIIAFEITITCYDSYGRLQRQTISNNKAFYGISQGENLKSGESSKATWTLNLFENTTKFNVVVTSVLFSDNSVWRKK